MSGSSDHAVEPSAELTAWIDAHRSRLVTQLARGPHAWRGDVPTVLRRLLGSPTLLAEAWGQIAAAMGELGIPAALQAEARDLHAALDAAVRGQRFSAAEQEELTVLLPAIAAATSPGDERRIVREALEAGRLSQRFAPMTQFGGRVWCLRCGFWGYLVGGAVSGVTACLLCVQTADPGQDLYDPDTPT